MKMFFIVASLSFFALIFSTAVVASSENVYILSSYGQLVTSSTLRWSWTNSTLILSTADPQILRVDNHAICRGWHQNQIVGGGTLKNGLCGAVFSDKMHFLKDFQVLTDISGTSKIEWQHWDMFTKRPFGIVAFKDKAFIAKVLSKDLSGAKRQSIGELDPHRGLSGDIAFSNNEDGKDDKAEFVTEGNILVETEPVRYELHDTEFVTKRAKFSNETVNIGFQTLVNPYFDDYESGDNQTDTENNNWRNTHSVIAYNATYRFYWGQIPGLIRTLPITAVTFDKSERLDFKWGLPLNFTRHRIVDVSHVLWIGTSMNVSATAIRRTSEIPYRATLVSFFPDDTTKKTRVEGTYRETVYTDIQTVHDSPYFPNNGSLGPTLAPTTTPTPTTTEATTTTKPTMRTYPLKPKRTTTPMPTSENPLLRFYPQDVENEVETLEEDYPSVETRWKKTVKDSDKSSPVWDSWTKSGTSVSDTIRSNLLSIGAAYVMFRIVV